MRQRSGAYNLAGVRSTGRRCGFTLIEVMLSLTIGTLLVVSIVSSTRMMTSARERVDRRARRMIEVRSAMATIVAALRNVRLDPTRDKPVLIGTSNPDADSDEIVLQVYCDRRARPDGAEGDLYEMAFYTVQRPGRDWPDLVCRKDHALDDDPLDGGIISVVAEGIVALTFSYCRDGEWEEQWPESEQKPPQAVRVTLAAVIPDERPRSEPPGRVVISAVVPIRLTVKGSSSVGGPRE